MNDRTGVFSMDNDEDSRSQLVQFTKEIGRLQLESKTRNDELTKIGRRCLRSWEESAPHTSLGERAARKGIHAMTVVVQEATEYNTNLQEELRLVTSRLQLAFKMNDQASLRNLQIDLQRIVERYRHLLGIRDRQEQAVNELEQIINRHKKLG